jgi:tetrahydromethanopterin S-methyltransferase subunit G
MTELARIYEKIDKTMESFYVKLDILQKDIAVIKSSTSDYRPIRDMVMMNNKKIEDQKMRCDTVQKEKNAQKIPWAGVKSGIIIGVVVGIALNIVADILAKLLSV